MRADRTASRRAETSAWSTILALLLLAGCQSAPQEPPSVGEEPAIAVVDASGELEDSGWRREQNPSQPSVDDLAESLPQAVPPPPPPPAPAGSNTIPDPPGLPTPTLTIVAPAPQGVLNDAVVSVIVTASSPAETFPADAVSLLEIQMLDPAQTWEGETSTYLRVIGGTGRLELDPGYYNGDSIIYRARAWLRDGRITQWTDARSVVLDLPFEPVELLFTGSTIDQTPTVSWRSDGRYVRYDFELRGSQVLPLLEASLTDTELTVADALSPGAYRYRVRPHRSDGFVGRWSQEQQFVIADSATPQPIMPLSGDTTLSEVVGLHWQPVRGGSRYEAVLLRDGEELGRYRTRSRSVQLPAQLVVDQAYTWQVRVQNDDGRWYELSAAQRFTVGEQAIDFLPIVEEGSSVTFRRGSAAGNADERPVRQITLTRPYQIGRYPITNAQLARYIEFARRRGLVELREEGVYETAETERLLVGLGDLDYGEQFGLRPADDAIVARSGRSEHPAIGVTWYGAVMLANLMSYAEHRPLAYDPETLELIPDSTGYRLPTEAEWEYAALGDLGGTLPFDAPLTEPYGDLLRSRVVNYFRSYDPFEDFSPPYTSRGGPTTPVGYFDGRVRDGFATFANVSPLGISDMVGNVWQWCSDRYDSGYYSSSNEVDPIGPVEVENRSEEQEIIFAAALEEQRRSLRGAAWNSRLPDIRATNRGAYAPSKASYSIGVRLVRGPISVQPAE